MSALPLKKTWYELREFLEINLFAWKVLFPNSGSLGGTSLCMIFGPTQVNVTIPNHLLGGRETGFYRSPGTEILISNWDLLD